VLLRILDELNIDKPTFYLADMFAEEKYATNQLAVFTDMKGLTDGKMQRIAQEMHCSETTFITSGAPRNEDYDVRIFTPETEMPFAGHPTLGIAYVIQHSMIKTPIPQILLNFESWTDPCYPQLSE
jgi:trans-2,3-dihydro-3-hydroxyanthranilate isomerase